MMARLPSPEVFATMSPAEQDAFFEKLSPAELDQVEFPKFEAKPEPPDQTEPAIAAVALGIVLLSAYFLSGIYLPGEFGVQLGRAHLLGVAGCILFLIARVHHP